ncbi:MAG: hypothetical protein ACLPSW_04530 [Roseiarcus sp.]
MSATLASDEVMPSATPTAAEIAAWQDLPRDEQVRRIRQALASPEALTPCEATRAEIWAEIEGDAARHG